MTKFLPSKESAQLPAPLQEPISSTETHTSRSTFVMPLIIYGGNWRLLGGALFGSKCELEVPQLTTCRNFGIMIALMVFGCAVYLAATELISAKKSKGEILIFRRGRMPNFRLKKDEEVNADDRIGVEILTEETVSAQTSGGLQEQTAVFQWDDVNYDIKVKKKTRRLLDQVDGWVKPGTLTALMVCPLISHSPIQQDN